MDKLESTYGHDATPACVDVLSLGDVPAGEESPTTEDHDAEQACVYVLSPSDVPAGQESTTSGSKNTRSPPFGWRGWLVICACFVVVSSSGVPHSFSAYANSFKAVFNLTQAQVETISSVMFIGTGANLPAGLMLDHVGPLGTMVTTTLLTSTGWLLMWSATQYIELIQENYFMLAIYIFIAAQGRTYGFVTGLTVAMQQVRTSLRAAMVVVVEAFFDIGSFIFVFVYQTTFIDGHVLDAKNQKLPEYFLTVAISVLFINVFGAIVIPRFRRGNVEIDLVVKEMHIASSVKQNGNEIKTDSGINIKETVQEQENEAKCYISHEQRCTDQERTHIEECLSFVKCSVKNSTILTANFQIILWASSILMSVCVFTSLNITYITGSLELTEYDYWLVLCHRIVVVVGRVLLGFPMALLRSFTSLAEIMLVFSAVLVLVCQIVLLFVGQLPVGIFVTVIGTGIAHGSTYILAPIMIHRYFGMDNYGRNVGVVYSVAPFLVLILQLLFGYSYDSAASLQETDSHSCYGKKCIVTGLAINIAISAIGLILSIALLVRNCMQRATSRTYNIGQ